VTAQAENLRGILLMVAAMAGFAVEDMLLKAAYRFGNLPVGEMLAIFGAGGALIFAVLTLRSGQRLFPPAAWVPSVAWKAGNEVLGRVFYTLAIALTPLSSASAILQATPLVVTLGAALFFGERVGWRRWTAIAVGFVGVLVILRPGLEGFTPASVFAVLGTLGFAGRDLATRAAPKALGNLVLGFYGFLVLVPTGLAMLALTGGGAVPTAPEALRLAGAIVFGTAAYYFLTAAMRLGEVSVVTPFRYTRLIFALILGVLVFGERPDAMTLAGAGIVVASGLYTILRARRARGG
jgi:drug/metabolite transporter (DMT)-like permease